MTISQFDELKLQYGDFIWIQNEKGEGFPGSYRGNFDRSKGIFSFWNNSKGSVQIVEIAKLQRLQRNN
jgi:hypothetical protein